MSIYDKRIKIRWPEGTIGPKRNKKDRRRARIFNQKEVVFLYTLLTILLFLNLIKEQNLNIKNGRDIKFQEIPK